MPQGSLARRYARAVMALGVEQNNYAAIGSQITTLASAMKTSDELSETLSNPAFPRSDRRKVVQALLDRINANQVTRNFVLLLLDRERLAALPDIARALNTMIDERSGRVTAQVTSATELTDGQVSKLKSTLEKLSGKQVHIEKRVDSQLLGGVVAKVGDIVYDGSLRTQLAQMRQELAS